MSYFETRCVICGCTKDSPCLFILIDEERCRGICYACWEAIVRDGIQKELMFARLIWERRRRLTSRYGNGVASFKRGGIMLKTIRIRKKDFAKRLRPLLRRKGVPAGAEIFSVSNLIPDWVHVTVQYNARSAKR